MESIMNRTIATEHVSFVVDDARVGRIGRELHTDPYAIVRNTPAYKHASILVGWQRGFEPLFVAVHSYFDISLDDDEAIEIATEYLIEHGWFSGEPKEPDYLIR